MGCWGKILIGHICHVMTLVRTQEGVWRRHMLHAGCSVDEDSLARIPCPDFSSWIVLVVPVILVFGLNDLIPENLKIKSACYYYIIMVK